MLPPRPTLSVHGAVLVLRRHVGVLVARVALEMVAASALAWPALSAWDELSSHVPSVRRVALCAGMVLVGLAANVILRVIYRAGTVRVLYARLRGMRERGVFTEGALAFPDAFLSQWLLSVLDVLWISCALLALALATILAERHTGTRQLASLVVGALCVAGTIGAGVLASAYGTLVYALGLLDGCDAADAWPRLMKVLGGVDDESRSRSLQLGLLLFFLTSTLACVDAGSALASWLLDVSAAPTALLLVPLVSAFTASVVDVSAALLVASLTDRLPVGLAARVALATPQGATPGSA